MKTRRPPRLPSPRLPLPGGRRAIQAYASAPSAPAGGTMEFRVSVPSGAACSVAVRRIGTPVPTPAVRFVGEDQDGAALTWVRVTAAKDGSGGGLDARFGDWPGVAGGGWRSTRENFGGGLGDGLGDGLGNGFGGDEAVGSGESDPAGGERKPVRDDFDSSEGTAGSGFGTSGGDSERGAGATAGSSQRPGRDGINAIGTGGPAGDLGVPLTWCDWEPSLLLDIPESWPPGLYVARFTVEAPLLSVMALRGRSAYVPFVVRGPLAAGFPTLVVLPFAAYIAANPWPIADVRRARALSLDRPFAGNGLPAGFAADAAFVEPLTATDFATSLDVHAGLVDPAAYRKVLFRADLWSPRMRAAIAEASLHGTDVGGLDGVPPPSVDFAPGPDGRGDRILIRY